MRVEFPVYDHDRIERDVKVDCERLYTHSALKDGLIAEFDKYGRRCEPDETRKQYLAEELQCQVNPPKQNAVSYIPGFLVLAAIVLAPGIYVFIHRSIDIANGVAPGESYVFPIVWCALLIGPISFYTIYSTVNKKRAAAKLKMLNNGGYVSYALTVTQKAWRIYQVHKSDDQTRTVENYYIQCGGLTVEVSKYDYIKVDTGKEFFVAVFDINGKKYAEIT